MSTSTSTTQAPPASRILAAFSLRRNLADVWHRTGDAFAPLDGLRAIAVLWVMLFHCFTIPTVQWVSAGNMVKFLDHPALSVAFSGHMGVELFLVLSGFLMAHMLIREIEQKGTTGFWPFIRRRWIRIVPVYAAAIAAHMLVDAHQNEVCTRWGWTNLLFINNFVGDQLNVNACLMHTWSIAVEFHLYLVSPLVVRWMYAPRWKLTRGDTLPPPEQRWGLAVPVILMVLGTIVSSVIVLRHWREPLGAWYLTTLYDKTYARTTPFFAGVAAAYLYHRRGARVPAKGARRYLVHAIVLGTIAAIACLGAGEHPSRYIPGAVDPHPWRDLFLLLFARQLIGLGVAYIIYETLTGRLRVIGNILSARIWVPLARLSYAAYLIEFVCMLPLFSLWAKDYATAQHFSDLAPALLANGLTAVVLTFVVALAFHLAVEKPFVNLR